MFSEHNGIKPEINNKKIIRNNCQAVWKSKQHTSRYQWMKEESKKEIRNYSKIKAYLKKKKNIEQETMNNKKNLNNKKLGTILIWNKRGDFKDMNNQ